jgi:hypothetical protein
MEQWYSPQSKSRYLKVPWIITSVHTNGTISVQCGNKSERINIQRVKLFEENLEKEF